VHQKVRRFSFAQMLRDQAPSESTASTIQQKRLTAYRMRVLERAHGLNYACAQRLPVKDALARQVDDACCDNFPMLNLAVDVESLAGFLKSFRHGVDILRLECGVIFKVATNWHSALPI